VVYAIQVEQFRELELAIISGGGELTPGEKVDGYDQWLYSEPEPVDHEKAQLFAALGVGPPV
jgi:hypothetical protein